MPRLLSAATIIEKNKIESEHPFAMLFELNIPGAAGPITLAGYDQDIVFHGTNFVRFPVDCDLLEDATSVSLVHLSVTAATVDQALMTSLELYWAPVADPQWTVKVWQIDAAAPDNVPYASADVFSVASVATNFLTATLDLIAEGLTLGQTIPKRRFTVSGGFPQIARRV